MAVIKETDEYRIIIPDYLESSELNNESVHDQNEQSELVVSGTSEEQNEDTQTEEIEEEENVTDYTDSLDTIIINQEEIITLLSAIDEYENDINENLGLTFSGVHFITNLTLVVVIVACSISIGKYFKSLF